MANPSRVNKKDGKVFSVGQIEIHADFINPLYEVKAQPPGTKIGDTGWLKVLDVTTKASGLPSFSGRWDQKEYIVDIDIHGVSKATERAFVKGGRGFTGHHTVRIPINKGWKFRLSIAVSASVFGGISDPRIFEGTVWLVGLARELEMVENVVAVSDPVTTAVILRPRGVAVDSTNGSETKD